MVISGWAGSAARWVAWMANAAMLAVRAWMPVYLLLMQNGSMASHGCGRW